MCTSIIFLHSIRFLNLEQLGCVSSLWKTVLKRLCLVTVEVVFFLFFFIIIPAIYAGSLCSVLAGTRPVSRKEEWIPFTINLLIWFTKSV